MLDDAVEAVRLAVALVVPGDPGLDLGVLVRRVVVDDQVQGQPVGHLAVDVLEKLQPLSVRVAHRGAADDLAVEIGQRSEQRDRAMAPVVMRLGSAIAPHDGKARLGALQRLTLALLVATQHQAPLRRVQVQAHHVPELLLEVAVVGQFEGARHVRLDVVGMPQALHRVLGHAGGARHAAHRPARPVRRRLAHTANNPLANLRVDTRLAPPARGVREAGQPRLAKTALPLDDHRAADAQLPSRGRLADAGGPAKHDRGSLMIPLRRGRPLHHRFQCTALGWRKTQGGRGARHDAHHSRAGSICQLILETVH